MPDMVSTAPLRARTTTSTDDVIAEWRLVAARYNKLSLDVSTSLDHLHQTGEEVEAYRQWLCDREFSPPPSRV